MQKAIIGKSFFDYLIYLPKNYNNRKKYPLVLFLHGSGERENYGNIDIVKRHGPPKLCEKQDFDAIIVSPQCKSLQVWNSYSHQIKDLIDEIINEYSVDTNAVSITGLSMGCFGLYQVLMDYPEVFSAAVAICGGGMEWRSDRILHIPLRIYHGEKDECVPVSHSKEMYSALKKGGAKDVELTLFPDEGHCCWKIVYEEKDVLDWLIKQRKD